MKIQINLKSASASRDDESQARDDWKSFRHTLPVELRNALVVDYSDCYIDTDYLRKATDDELTGNKDDDAIIKKVPDLEKLQQFYDLIKPKEDLVGQRSAIPQLSSIIRVLTEGPKGKIGSLKNLEPLWNGYINKARKNYANGRRADMVFRTGSSWDKNRAVIPIRIDSIVYHPPSGKQDYETVRVQYHYFKLFEGTKLVCKKETGYQSFSTESVRGITLAEFFAVNNFLEVTDDLLAVKYEGEDYAVNLIQNFIYEQVVVDQDMALQASKDKNKSWWYSRSEETKEEDATNLLSAGGGRCILDPLGKDGEAISPSDFRTYQPVPEARGLLITDLPVFHLTHNTHYNVPSVLLRPYAYNPEIVNELVIEDKIRILLDTLTDFSGQDDEYDDIVKGKKSATAVLMMGPPGVGKSLTGQVYSEKIKRPLYVLDSGRLGTTPGEIVKNLKLIISRANRWRCPVQLDECDSFIRARGFDIEQNAVVVAFLETLEYSEVTIFLTTNRGFEIDDAIFSRCAAIIRFNKPALAERRKLWPVLAPHFFPAITKQENWKVLAEELAEKYEGISGRDIKMILNLARRYARNTHKTTWTAEDFDIMVEFRQNPNNELKDAV